MTDLFFGSGTQSAVLTFQACSGVAETGTADAATWAALLKDDPAFAVQLAAPPAAAPAPAPAASSPAASGAEASAGAFGGLFPSAVSVDAERAAAAFAPAAAAAMSGTGDEEVETFEEWPLLMESDGGRAVHTLQARMHILVTRGSLAPSCMSLLGVLSACVSADQAGGGGVRGR